MSKHPLYNSSGLKKSNKSHVLYAHTNKHFPKTNYFLFAFQSKYLLNYNIQVHCDKILHKRAYDICYSYKYKTPIMSVYQINSNLISSKIHYSRKGLNFTPDYNLHG